MYTSRKYATRCKPEALHVSTYVHGRILQLPHFALVLDGIRYNRNLFSNESETVQCGFFPPY